MESKVRIFYLRDERRFPVACIASSWKDNVLSYAVATHNPKDVYNRELARHIATARLDAVLAGRNGVPEMFKHFSGRIPCTDSKTAKVNLLIAVASHSKLPQRARDAAANWIVSTQKFLEEKKSA